MSFVNGQVLTADELNLLDTGIESGAYRLISNMRAGLSDVTVICNSDSTGITGDYDNVTYYNKWLYKLAVWLGEQYPTYTVRYYDVVPSFYNAVQILQTGKSKITAAVVASGGSGYATSDHVYLDGGITLNVTGVSSGAITSVSILAPGAKDPASLPTNPVSQTGTNGSGSGAVFTLTWGQGPTLYFYNGALAGTQPTYLMGNRLQAVFNPRSNADLIIFNHGHNTDGNASANTQAGMDMAAIYTIRGFHPAAGVIVVSQNPIRETDSGTNRSAGARQAAIAGGFSVIDVHQMYLEAGKPSAWYRTIPDTLAIDTIHPGSVGDDMIFGLAKKLFTWPLVPKHVRPGLQFGQNLLLNGDFSTWTDTESAPDNWSMSGITLAQETTSGLFESGSYSVQATSTGTSEAYLEQALPSALVRQLAGKVVTLSLRCYVPASNTSSTAARMRITEIDNTTPYGIPTGGRDGFIWKSVVISIPATATSLTVRVMADTSVSGSLCYLDRVCLSVGDLPQDFY